jgi:hypothetical protein
MGHEFNPTNVSDKQALSNKERSQAMRRIRRVIPIVGLSILAACGTTKTASADTHPNKSTTTTSRPVKAPASSTTTVPSPIAQGGLNSNYDLCNVIPLSLINQIANSNDANCTNTNHDNVSAEWDFTDAWLSPGIKAKDHLTVVIQPASKLVNGKTLPDAIGGYASSIGVTTESDPINGDPGTWYGNGPSGTFGSGTLPIPILITTIDKQATGETYFLETASDWKAPVNISEQGINTLASVVIQNSINGSNSVFKP